MVKMQCKAPRKDSALGGAINAPETHFLNNLEGQNHKIFALRAKKRLQYVYTM
jgi:hypothetical protein